MGLNEIRVDKNELIKVLKGNRSKHHELFLNARKEFRSVILDQLQLRLQNAQNGTSWEPNVLNGLNILAPEDHTDEYDKAIGMLEMSVDDTVLITHDEYRQYVLDEWFWKDRNLRALASSRTAKASYTP